MSMKHINSTGMALLLGVTVICAAAQLARGAEGREGKLFITGEANAMAEYDMAKVTVSITAEEKNTSVVGTAAIAQSKHSEAVQSLLSSFQFEGIPMANISTRSLRISPIQNWTDGQSTVIGYEVDQDLVLDVKTSDATLIPRIYQQVSAFLNNLESEAGLKVQVSNLSPYVSDELKETFEEELFSSCFANAQRKAELMAKGARRELGLIQVVSDRPIDVENADEYPPPSPFPETSLMYDAAPVSSRMGSSLPLGKGQKLSKQIFLEYSLK